MEVPKDPVKSMEIPDVVKDFQGDFEMVPSEAGTEVIDLQEILEREGIDL